MQIIQCDNGKFSEPLKSNEIQIDNSIDRVYMKVEVRRDIFRFAYSFDNEEWIYIPVDFESGKLSDDYVRGEGFFTGAFVGICCQDLSGYNNYADFDYFEYKEIYE